jgi:phosphatidylserine/phosphatidylglycerophosphate/cardiolipin synthase-like enzyme
MDIRLLDALYAVARAIPYRMVESLGHALHRATPGAWNEIAATAGTQVANPAYRRHVSTFVQTWQTVAAHEPPAGVASALMAAAYAIERERQEQRIELVWTGPGSGQPLRRTAQVIENVIDEALHEILIVSFAVYDIPDIGAALARATQRGVRIRLVIESPQDSAGKIAYDGLAAFGAEVAAQADVYRWPLEQRQRDEQGKYGSLHAKCAVADGKTLFISSANLTRYALSLNMELGVLIHGGPQPRDVQAHLNGLMQRGVLTRITVRDSS